MRDQLLTLRPRADQKDVRGFEWHYLWRFGQGFMRADGHRRVSAGAYSADGTTFASGSESGTVCLFDRHTGRLTAKLPGHASAVNTLDFLKDDTLLLSTAFEGYPVASGFRGEFILWRLGTENTILRRGSYSHHWKAFGHTMFAPAPAARALFVIDYGTPPQRLLRLDLDTGKQQVVFQRDGNYLSLVASTPRADKLALVQKTADERGCVCLDIMDPVTGKVISACVSRPIYNAVFSPDGTTLVLAVDIDKGSRAVQIRDVPSLRLRKSIEFASVPYSVRFDRSGRHLAVVTVADDWHSELHLLDLQTGSSLGSYVRGTGMPPAFSPDGEEMAIVDGDDRIRTGKNVFDPQDTILPQPLPTSEAWCLAFAPDGKTLAAGYDHDGGETLRLWDLRTKKAKTLTGHDSTVMAMAISPDGKTMATASYDRSVRVWDLSTGECREKLHGHTGPVRALAFSPDGLRLASAGSDLSIKIWNVKDGSPRNSWHGHNDMIRSLTFSPDGNLLISAANDQTIKVWRSGDGTLIREIANQAKVQSVACSPDGALLASGDENNKVEIWDIASGALVKTFPGHSGKVRSVAFSPDGKTLASGGEDKTVRLWNVLTGQELLVFPTEHFVNGLAFDRRGKTLAAALHDGTVKVWAAE